MAHNLANINGKVAFFGTQPAWHNLGQIVDKAQNWQEAMSLAQLDWTVSKHQLISPINGELVPAWGIFRDDNQAMLGTVGNVYTEMQNKFAFDFIDTILEAEGSAHYVSAGALGQGEQIWCLASINGQTDITGTGDYHNHYLLFTTSHDGSKSTVCKLTTVRVVCNNTLNQALRMSGELTKVKHTKTGQDKLTAAKNLVSGAIMGIDAITEKLRELNKRMVSKGSITTVMKRLFGDFEESKRSENKAVEVLRLFESNDNDMFPENRGTAYNLLNAITEYTDHFSGVRQTESRQGMTELQMRSENAMFGNGSDLKEKALEIIMESTANDNRKMERSYQTIINRTSEGKESKSLLDSILDNQ